MMVGPLPHCSAPVGWAKALAQRPKINDILLRAVPTSGFDTRRAVSGGQGAQEFIPG